jgi:hypothetical protein
MGLRPWDFVDASRRAAATDQRSDGQELLSGSYIQADETAVGVQMHDGREKNHQAYLWQYNRPGGSVLFDFRMGGSGKVQAVLRQL